MTEAIEGRLSKSIPSTHNERLEMESRLTGQLAAAFVICECFHFWHLVKLAEANQAKDFPATRRLTPAYAQRFVQSINSKRNSGVNPKDRLNFIRLCLSWRVSQRGKEWLWLGTQTLVAAILWSAFYLMDPGMCGQHCGILTPALWCQDLAPHNSV